MNATETRSAHRESNGRTRLFWGLAIALLIGVILLGVATALLGVVTTSALAADRDRRNAEPFHWQGRLEAGQTIEIRGINGHIRAVAAGGAEGTVDAERTGRRSDPARVKIQVEETADGVRICALYPRPDGSLNDDCHDQKTRNNDVSVAFRVRVPSGVRLLAHTVNGGVEVDDLDSAVEASTVNGGITIATSGLARATTVNGGIEARVGDSRWSGALEFETVNGSIEVTLPSSLDCDLDASTVNGHVESDFSVGVQGRMSRRRIRGVIGDGGPELRMSTVNGSIHLRSGTRGDRSH